MRTRIIKTKVYKKIYTVRINKTKQHKTTQNMTILSKSHVLFGEICIYNAFDELPFDINPHHLPKIMSNIPLCVSLEIKKNSVILVDGKW
jgi:hypothetical protein